MIRLRDLLLLLVPALLVSGCVTTVQEAPRVVLPKPDPPVVLLTDFGLQDDAVGLMRGVILEISPGSQVVDLTHQVPAFDVAEGARLLADAPEYYPSGSVFCVVVDPGVGTSRRAIVAELNNGRVIVAPDNGVITEAARKHGVREVRVVQNDALVRAELSSTFHGRDVFAPVSAHLAAGKALSEVGPAIQDWVRLKSQAPQKKGDVLYGVVEALDLPFGNVWTNFPSGWLAQAKPGDRFEVQLGKAKAFTVPFAKTFGEVAEGQPLLYVNSRGKLALALNQGNFARAREVKRGVQVRVRPSP